MTQLDIIPLEEWGIFSSTDRPLLIAGPCSAESRQQLTLTAEGLHAEGIELLRAGIWKPRTRPGQFEGVGTKGLKWMTDIRQATGMKIATEVANIKHLHAALRAEVDLIWIGARTSANPFAVQEIADGLIGTDVAVLVKNPVNPDVDLWLGALERINRAGIKRLGTIHRGFSVYGEHRYRNEPQWQLPIELKRRVPNLPMFCDPSHIAGDRRYLEEISQKALDLGFDGLMVESHCHPACALSDAGQQLTPSDLKEMLDRLVVRSSVVENESISERIHEIRNDIDRIDDRMVALLSDRLKLTDTIGQYKKEANVTILQKERWNSILNRVYALGDSMDVPKELLEKIFKAIHQTSIDRQSEKLTNE